MEPWRVCRPVVEDKHHFDEKPDPDLHQKSVMSDSDPENKYESDHCILKKLIYGKFDVLFREI